MKLVDLTYPITEGMPVFPGTTPPIIVDSVTVEKDGFAEKLLTFFSHTGTHMDAPAHIFGDGMTLDEMPLDSFIGRAVVADLRNVGSSVVEVEDLAPYESSLRNSDYLLCLTGWSRLWGNESYFRGFPILSGEACRWLVEMDLKGIGMDAISVDPVDSMDLPNHRIFLGAGMVIVENLKNLELLPRETDFYCLPMKIGNSDGAPVRAVASRL